MNVQANKASRSKLVVLGGLSVVAAAVGFRMMSSGPTPAPAATMTPPPVASVLPPPLQTVRGAADIVWPTDITRDPFHSDLVFPPAAPPPEPKVDVHVITPTPPVVDLAALVQQKIQLKGTILGERPIAMMNGRVYRVGEVVEGFIIVEIEKNQITVERDGTRLVVKVN